MVMNELKAYTSVDIEEIDNAKLYNNGKLDCTRVYLKSEADKVIAELKADYKEACDRLQTANLIKDEQLAETRHQKWKRSLAMADMCAERRMYWTYRLQDDGDKGYSKDYKFGKNCFWRKWCVRWLALADKFKNKEA